MNSHTRRLGRDIGKGVSHFWLVMTIIATQQAIYIGAEPKAFLAISDMGAISVKYKVIASPLNAATGDIPHRV